MKTFKDMLVDSGLTLKARNELIDKYKGRQYGLYDLPVYWVDENPKFEEAFMAYLAQFPKILQINSEFKINFKATKMLFGAFREECKALVLINEYRKYLPHHVDGVEDHGDVFTLEGHTIIVSNINPSGCGHFYSEGIVCLSSAISDGILQELTKLPAEWQDQIYLLEDRNYSTYAEIQPLNKLIVRRGTVAPYNCFEWNKAVDLKPYKELMKDVEVRSTTFFTEEYVFFSGCSPEEVYETSKENDLEGLYLGALKGYLPLKAHPEYAGMLAQGMRRKVFEGMDNIPAFLMRDYLKSLGILSFFNDATKVDLREFPKLGAFKGALLKQVKLNTQSLVESWKTLQWIGILGLGASHLDWYWLNHFPKEWKGEVPSKFHVELAKSDRALRFVFNGNLDINWDVSKSLKANILIALREKYSLTDAQLSQAWENPSISESLLRIKDLPDNTGVVLNPLLPEVNYISSEGYTLSMLPKTSVENLYLGDLTSCCQHLGGAGEDVCIEGWDDPNSINYVIKSPSGAIYAHFWVWVNNKGNIIIDSVEGRDDERLRVNVIELVSKFYREHTNSLLATTDYGYTSEVAEHLGLGGRQSPGEPVGIKYSYLDANKVYEREL